jgi:hypothetical protein
MALRDLTKDNIRVRDLIDFANNKQNIAETNLIDLVSWISPIGDTYIGTRAEITEMIQTGSWR